MGGDCMKRNLVTFLTALLLCLGLSVQAVGDNTGNKGPGTDAAAKAPEKPSIVFSDVKPEDYFADAVRWAVENEITNGTSPTKFSPNAACTRAQVVTFLWRAEGCPKPETENTFSDVGKRAYYRDAVSWAMEREITNGVSTRNFGPSRKCTRAQILTFLWRGKGLSSADGTAPNSTETPVASSGSQEGPAQEADSRAFSGHWASDALNWAMEQGLLDKTEKDFKPDEYCPRADVVLYLFRCYQNDTEEETNVKDTEREDSSILFEASTPAEFAAETAKLIQEYQNKVNVTASDGVYATGRLIIKAETLPVLNAYHPARILRDTDGHYVVQFLSDMDAAACAGYLHALPGIEYVEPDRIITADTAASGGSSAGIAVAGGGLMAGVE